MCLWELLAYDRLRNKDIIVRSPRRIIVSGCFIPFPNRKDINTFQRWSCFCTVQWCLKWVPHGNSSPKTKLEGIGRHKSFLEYKHLFLAEINGPSTKRIPNYINEVTSIFTQPFKILQLRKLIFKTYIVSVPEKANAFFFVFHIHHLSM